MLGFQSKLNLHEMKVFGTHFGLYQNLGQNCKAIQDISIKIKTKLADFIYYELSQYKTTSIMQTA